MIISLDIEPPSKTPLEHAIWAPIWRMLPLQKEINRSVIRVNLISKAVSLNKSREVAKFGFQCQI